MKWFGKYMSGLENSRPILRDRGQGQDGSAETKTSSVKTKTKTAKTSVSNG